LLQVLLQPSSGRRHQLRVHMLTAGGRAPSAVFSTRPYRYSLYTIHHILPIWYMHSLTCVYYILCTKNIRWLVPVPFHTWIPSIITFIRWIPPTINFIRWIPPTITFIRWFPSDRAPNHRRRGVYRRQCCATNDAARLVIVRACDESHGYKARKANAG
jgi:hypothetical protein